MGLVAIDATPLWSINRIAAAFEIDNATVKRRLSAACIEPNGKTENGYPAYRIKSVAALFCDPIRGKNDDPESLSPKDRLDWYKGDMERIKLERERGNLIPVDEFRERLADVIKILLAGIEPLPDLLERKARLDANQVEKVIQVIREVRTGLCEKLQSLPSKTESGANAK